MDEAEEEKDKCAQVSTNESPPLTALEKFFQQQSRPFALRPVGTGLNRIERKEIQAIQEQATNRVQSGSASAEMTRKKSVVGKFIQRKILQFSGGNTRFSEFTSKQILLKITEYAELTLQLADASATADRAARSRIPEEILRTTIRNKISYTTEELHKVNAFRAAHSELKALVTEISLRDKLNSY